MSQSGNNAGGIGVVSHQMIAVPRHAVHCTQPPGQRTEVLKTVGHLFFVRHRHRQTSQPEGNHGLKRPVSLPTLSGEGHVDPVQAGRCKGSVVHCR